MPITVKKSLVAASANDSLNTATAWIPINLFPDAIAVAFAISGCSGNQYRVQHTFDDVQDRSITPYAFVHSDATAVKTDFAGNYVVPPRAVRLQLTSAAASGRSSATFWLTQSGV